MDGSWPLRTSNFVTFHALSASIPGNEGVRYSQPIPRMAARWEEEGF